MIPNTTTNYARWETLQMKRENSGEVYLMNNRFLQFVNNKSSMFQLDANCSIQRLVKFWSDEYLLTVETFINVDNNNCQVPFRRPIRALTSQFLKIQSLQIYLLNHFI